MKKIMIAAMAVVLPTGLMAQSAIDAYNLSQNDLRGTARFMSMAGAFGALGGDLSTLNQNPAGIGVYRSSEIGLTLDFDFMSSNTYNGAKTNDTRVYCPNVGYIGAINIGGEMMPYFQWGISYGRVASFDRTVKGGIADIGVSLSNFAAFGADGYDPAYMGQSNSFNPYQETNYNWLGLLAYNAYAINPQGNTDNYNGLFQYDSNMKPISSGNAEYNIRQRGAMDEYSINFGGNVMNTVYWGLGFGITDISFTEESYYNENILDAAVYDTDNKEMITGDAYNSLGSYSRTTGNGFNIKLGAIIKPINELRIGIAVHTPTWYNLTTSRSGDLYYEYFDIGNTNPFNKGTAKTDNSFFDWKLRSPWKFMISGAAVIGGRFIASLDYELDAYQNMRVSDNEGTQDKYVTEDVKNYFKPQHNIRLGVEYRLTPQFSLRGGIAESLSAVKSEANNGEINVYTNGYYEDNTNPSYNFTTNTRYLTLGFGYRYHGFYVDAAYVNKYRHCTYHPYSSFGDFYAPAAKYAIGENNLVLSIGYKF